MRAGVAALSEPLDEPVLGGVDVPDLPEAEGTVPPGLEAEALGDEADGLVAAEGLGLGQGAVGGRPEVGQRVRDGSLGGVREFPHGDDGVGLLLAVHALRESLDGLRGRLCRGGRRARQEDGHVLHGGGRPGQVTDGPHEAKVVPDGGDPVPDPVELVGRGEGPGLLGLGEGQLVEQASVPGVPAQEALLGELLVVHEGHDLLEPERALLVVEAVEDELVGALLRAHPAGHQAGSLEVVPGRHGLGGLKVGRDLLGRVDKLLGLLLVGGSLGPPGGDAQLSRRRGGGAGGAEGGRDEGAHQGRDGRRGQDREGGRRRLGEGGLHFWAGKRGGGGGGS